MPIVLPVILKESRRVVLVPSEKYWFALGKNKMTVVTMKRISPGLIPKADETVVTEEVARPTIQPRTNHPINRSLPQFFPFSIAMPHTTPLRKGPKRNTYCKGIGMELWLMSFVSNSLCIGSLRDHGMKMRPIRLGTIIIQQTTVTDVGLFTMTFPSLAKEKLTESA